MNLQSLIVIHIQREIFSKVVSLDTWNHVIKEEDKQNLEQLLPKIEGQSHEDVIKYLIVILALSLCTPITFQCIKIVHIRITSSRDMAAKFHSHL